MSETPITTLNCTQCGGELHPDEGETFVTCPFCGSTVYIDKSQVVFHWALAPTLDQAQAEAALRRWMSGSSTVKNLDTRSKITGQVFQYFPLWYFRWSADGRDGIALEPAAATSITELRRLALTSGDLEKYDPGLDHQAVEPTVPLESAREWLETSHPAAAASRSGAEVRETALVHVPIYLFKYTYQGRTYTAVVEAASGGVLANVFPAKAEAPYLLAGGITALVYLCLALLPVAGGAVLGKLGVAGWLGIALVLALVAAPFLFAFAVWVASRI